MINAVTKNLYSENNTAQLIAAGFDSIEWAGYNQWLSVGRQVKKGEKATKIIMICDKKHTDSNGEESKRKAMKTLAVFNKDQTEEVAA